MEIVKSGNIEYKIIDGTAYHKDTPDEVVKVLESARNNRTRIKLYYGDVETGRDWHEEHDTVGTIGRSTGSIKVPLLIKTSRSYGGGAILDHAIVKIKDAKTGRILYQHPKYKAPVIEIVKSDLPEYEYNTIVDGQLYGRHKTLRSAEMLKSKLMENGGSMAGGGEIRDISDYIGTPVVLTNKDPDYPNTHNETLYSFNESKETITIGDSNYKFNDGFKMGMDKLTKEGYADVFSESKKTKSKYEYILEIPLVPVIEKQEIHLINKKSSGGSTMEAGGKAEKRKEIKYEKLVGRIGNEYYFLDYVFDDTLHGKGWKGAVASRLRPVSKEEYEERKDVDYIIDNYDYLWKDMVQAGRTTDSLKDWAQEVFDTEGDDFFWDLSYQKYWQQLRDIGLGEDEYPIFEATGGGRSFSKNMEFDEVYDPELIKIINKYEKEEKKEKGGEVNKVAKLVKVSFMTRVVVNKDATDEQIIDKARPKFVEKVKTELGENIEEIVDDEEVPFDPNSDDDFEKGGRLKSAIARERKYTSREEHEKSYKGKRKSRVRYYQTHEAGGEAGKYKISYQKHWHPTEGTVYDQTVKIDKRTYDHLRDAVASEIAMGYPQKNKYVWTSGYEFYLKPLSVENGRVYLNHTQTRFINMFLKLPLKDRNTMLRVVDKLSFGGLLRSGDDGICWLITG